MAAGGQEQKIHQKPLLSRPYVLQKATTWEITASIQFHENGGSK
jgi:hypothetical protein